MIQVITHSQCPRNNSALGPKARPPATKEGERKRRGMQGLIVYAGYCGEGFVEVAEGLMLQD